MVKMKTKVPLQKPKFCSDCAHRYPFTESHLSMDKKPILFGCPHIKHLFLASNPACDKLILNK